MKNVLPYCNYLSVNCSPVDEPFTDMVDTFTKNLTANVKVEKHAPHICAVHSASLENCRKVNDEW